jgi:adenine phosphoribosyltransferase
MNNSLKRKIRSIPDFPKKGIVFRDLTTLFQDHGAFREALSLLHNYYRDRRIDKVCGIEARGFIIGGALADRLNCGFVTVRKAGKLPAATVREKYELEYGTAELEIHRDAIEPGKNVLIVDDLLATGGTLAASCSLVKKLGATVFGVAAIVELSYLHGRDKLAGYDVFTLVEYDSEQDDRPPG